MNAPRLAAACSYSWIDGPTPHAHLIGPPDALRDLADLLAIEDDVVTLALSDGSGSVERRWTDDDAPAILRGLWFLEPGPTLVLETRRDVFPRVLSRVREIADLADTREPASGYLQVNFVPGGERARRHGAVAVRISARWPRPRRASLDH